MEKDNNRLDFKTWLRAIWAENVIERDGFNEPPYTQKEYFQKYKYWLKREYRFQQKKPNR
ncbi:MAG: hypothetical protein EBZ58_13920 [Bacteroidetes bacterium]|nr:hypothetical protein [Bacteroidota bacterium]